MSAAPMASGAITPAPPPTTVQPTVRTRKNVPMNSAIYLFIRHFLPDTVWKKQDNSNETLVLSAPSSARRPTDSREACLPLVSEELEKCEGLRQATNFVQIKSRMIAPMIDKMKPAG